MGFRVFRGFGHIRRSSGIAALVATLASGEAVAFAQQPPTTASQSAPQPQAGAQSQTRAIDRFRDREDGVPLSMFGTYLRGRELIVYPYYEYYRDRNYEYKPSEFGFPVDVDYRGRYRAHEGLIFMAYGLTDSIAVELEAAVIDATLEKATDDPSGLPATINESGLGDIETQLRWRWRRETETRPELFSYAEAVVPHAKDRSLIGTPGWELTFGAGLIRGFSGGTLTLRAAIQYEQASDTHFGGGEYAVEYLRRLSPAFRLFASVEGTEDEIELISELQWHLSRNAFVKVSSGFGVTSKAIDWAPEVGLVLRFGPR